MKELFLPQRIPVLYRGVALGEASENTVALPSTYKDELARLILFHWSTKGRGTLTVNRDEFTSTLGSILELYWELTVAGMTVKFLQASPHVRLHGILYDAGVDDRLVDYLDRTLALVPMSGQLVNLAKELYPVLISHAGTVGLPHNLSDIREKCIQLTELIQDEYAILLALTAMFTRPAYMVQSSVEGVRASCFNYGYRGSDGECFFLSEIEHLLAIGYPTLWFSDYKEVEEFSLESPEYFMDKYVVSPELIEANLTLLAAHHLGQQSIGIGGAIKFQRNGQNQTESSSERERKGRQGGKPAKRED